MLQQLLPNLDWSYVNRDGRKWLLSKQTKENLRQAKKNCNEWLLVTPTEYNNDELMVCIACDEQSNEFDVAKTYISLMTWSKSEPRFFNWSQLENTKTKHLHNKLVRECKKSVIDPPSFKSVENWILTARNFSVDEVLTEIVGTDDNIHGLLEAAYSNTPKDLLTYWSGHPNLLLEAMGKHPKNEDNLFHVHYQEKDARH